ncbi:hypothetical protein FKB36_09960 [Methanoculleus sp. Afa-1]|uniref:JAB domain-containing protein n=1 Tax=Methanoculleus formosensis TaxID=2590886 RepID=A0A9E5DEH9_9EURY|nr:hypothetical protein [Methanoculleus sp. Afa-1]MCT8337799.1 hypothetical protein [Methanoculleus sp. Afa-1]
MTVPQIFCRHPDTIHFEKEIRHLSDQEVVGIFTSQGELLHSYSSDYNGVLHVKIPDADRLSSQHQILTHNHPSGTSFSLPDLETAAKLDVAEIRVVGETGVYSMMPPPDGWPEPGIISDQFREVDSDPEFDSRMLDIKFSAEFLDQAKDIHKDIVRIRSDLHCRLVADTVGLVYEGACWKAE